jgi:hypothetical protein
MDQASSFVLRYNRTKAARQDMRTANVRWQLKLAEGRAGPAPVDSALGEGLSARQRARVQRRASKVERRARRAQGDSRRMEKLQRCVRRLDRTDHWQDEKVLWLVFLTAEQGTFIVALTAMLADSSAQTANLTLAAWITTKMLRSLARTSIGLRLNENWTKTAILYLPRMKFRFRSILQLVRRRDTIDGSIMRIRRIATVPSNGMGSPFISLRTVSSVVFGFYTLENTRVVHDAAMYITPWHMRRSRNARDRGALFLSANLFNGRHDDKEDRHTRYACVRTQYLCR